MPEPRDPAPAVSRSLRILSVLEESSAPLSLSEIARRLDIAKSSTGNLCAALEEGAMIERTDQGYRLGRRTAELGGAFAEQFNQIREFFGVCAASEVLRGEVVQIAMLDGTDMLYLARHEGRTPQRFGTPLGSRLPAALSATGNALLSTLADEQIRALLAGTEPFPSITEHSISTIDALLTQVHEHRRRGYAIDTQQSWSGVTGVAVALEPWSPGDPPLAMGAALPGDLDEAQVERVGRALVEAAALLTNPLAIGRTRA